jgi:hypothetical protein
MNDERVGPPIDGLSVAIIDGRVSIYAPHTEQALMLNETASTIWLLATGAYTAEEIVEAAAEQHGVAPDDVRDEVLGTIRRFYAENLLARAAQPVVE